MDDEQQSVLIESWSVTCKLVWAKNTHSMEQTIREARKTSQNYIFQGPEEKKFY